MNKKGPWWFVYRYGINHTVIQATSVDGYVARIPLKNESEALDNFLSADPYGPNTFSVRPNKDVICVYIPGSIREIEIDVRF